MGELLSRYCDNFGRGIESGRWPASLSFRPYLLLFRHECEVNQDQKMALVILSRFPAIARSKESSAGLPMKVWRMLPSSHRRVATFPLNCWKSRFSPSSFSCPSLSLASASIFTPLKISPAKSSKAVIQSDPVKSVISMARMNFLGRASLKVPQWRQRAWGSACFLQRGLLQASQCHLLLKLMKLIQNSSSEVRLSPPRRQCSSFSRSRMYFWTELYSGSRGCSFWLLEIDSQMILRGSVPLNLVVLLGTISDLKVELRESDSRQLLSLKFLSRTAWPMRRGAGSMDFPQRITSMLLRWLGSPTDMLRLKIVRPSRSQLCSSPICSTTARMSYCRLKFMSTSTSCSVKTPSLALGMQGRSLTRTISLLRVRTMVQREVESSRCCPYSFSLTCPREMRKISSSRTAPCSSRASSPNITASILTPDRSISRSVQILVSFPDRLLNSLQLTFSTRATICHPCMSVSSSLIRQNSFSSPSLIVSTRSSLAPGPTRSGTGAASLCGSAALSSLLSGSSCASGWGRLCGGWRGMNLRISRTLLPSKW